MFKISTKLKPIVLCILDGWGIAPDYEGNAITRARPANFNSLWFAFPHTYLATDGSQVGLPPGQPGNSEVCHLNIGAGKIVFQDVMKITSAISDGSFFENEAMLAAIDHAIKNKSNIHVMGLVGAGVVHSSINHLFAILELIKREQIPPERVKIHLFTDGRDTPPTSAKDFVTRLTEKIKSQKLGVIATVIGRYYAMDRDNRWERTKEAYEALIGKSENKAYDPIVAIDMSYTEGTTDEFIKPTVICTKDGKPTGAVSQNDSVILFNFRPDRGRQLTKAFVLDNLGKVKTTSGETVETFQRGPKIQNLFFATMTNYQEELPVSAIAYTMEQVDIPLGRVFSERNLRQFHIAETEKYAHVTYFINGGREQPFYGEDRLLVNSPKVASYDLKPEMSTPEITKHLVSRINSRVYDLIIVNLANADMVGHTGNFEAAVKAVKSADLYLGIISKSVLSAGGALIVTADHGNAEQMIDPKTGQIDTAHNANPAPFIICTEDLRGNSTQLPKGILADVAPTILGLLHIPKPSQMTGRNLLE